MSLPGEQHVATLKVAQGWEVVCDPFTKGEYRYVILQEQEHVVSGVLDKLVLFLRILLWWTMDNLHECAFFSIKV